MTPTEAHLIIAIAAAFIGIPLVSYGLLKLAEAAALLFPIK